MDINETGILTFRDLSYLLGALLKGDPAEKLTLLYKCHVPPAFNLSDLDDLRIPSGKQRGLLSEFGTTAILESDEPELATDASALLDDQVFEKAQPQRLPKSTSDPGTSRLLAPDALGRQMSSGSPGSVDKDSNSPMSNRLKLDAGSPLSEEYSMPDNANTETSGK